MIILLQIGFLALSFLGALTSFAIGTFMQTVVHEAEAVQVTPCDGAVYEVGTACPSDVAAYLPDSAREIVLIDHPQLDGQFLVYEDATKQETFQALDSLEIQRISGAFSGEVEVPDAIAEEFGVETNEPHHFWWDISFWEGEVVVIFVTSTLELERAIIYIP
jgi:hypothetical protein